MLVNMWLRAESMDLMYFWIQNYQTANIHHNSFIPIRFWAHLNCHRQLKRLKINRTLCLKHIIRHECKRIKIKNML